MVKIYGIDTGKKGATIIVSFRREDDFFYYEEHWLYENNSTYPPVIDGECVEIAGALPKPENNA